MKVDSRTGVATVHISRIEVVPLKIWLQFKRFMSKGAVTPAKDREWVMNPVLVRVESAEGAEGFARVWAPNPFVGETTVSIAGAIRHYYGPALIGRDAMERESTIDRLEKLLPNNAVALACIDIALHDLVGKTLGLPVFTLMGGARTTVPLNWSVSLHPLEVMLEEALGAVRNHGIRILCLKAGPSHRWESDVEIFKAVRAAVGRDVEIGIDANEGYDLPTALRALRALEGERVAYIEQPLPRHDLDGLALLRGGAGVPVLVDESACSLADAYRVVSHKACDGFVLKLWKSGGFTNTKKIATLAEAAGLQVILGGTAQGSILEAAAYAHMFASLPVPPLAAELVLGLTDLDRDPIAKAPPELTLRQGETRVPIGPGLGVQVDMSAARELALAQYIIEKDH